MKSIIARGLRRTATALNTLAEHLEPAKERLEAAQEAAQAAIERARTATVETVEKVRQEARNRLSDRPAQPSNIGETAKEVAAHVVAFAEGFLVGWLLIQMGFWAYLVGTPLYLWLVFRGNGVPHAMWILKMTDALIRAGWWVVLAVALTVTLPVAALFSLFNRTSVEVNHA